jgi:RNA polymerase sigma-54 factor
MKLQLTARLTQRLVMTPALQQAIKMLPLTRMELIASIRQELDENPFLEEVAPDDTQDSESEELPKSEKTEFEEEAVLDNGKKTEDTEPDWESFLQETAYSGATGEGYSEKPSLENTLEQEASLHEHLTWQLNVSVLDPVLNEIGAAVIGNMDEDGFMRLEPAEIAREAGCTVEQVNEVLDIIHTKFDPPGVCASDIKHSLLLQAQQLEPDDPVISELVTGHLHHLTEGNYARIARELRVDVERIIESVEFIKTLKPSPGAAFNPKMPDYVEPDLYVVKVDDEWRVLLNDDGMPTLKINNQYRRILKKNGMGADAKEKEFVEKKIQSALWMVKSIEQRRQTMLKVGRSLVKFQRGFLEHGISHLRPLVLRDVAEDIEMHESTVSRVTRNKYIHTSQGLFELKFFFHSGVKSYLGSDVSSVRVKEMIKKIVMEEDPKRPFTDDKIVGLLNSRDVRIARRTVTKYRKELAIPAGSKRKKLY